MIRVVYENKLDFLIDYIERSNHIADSPETVREVSSIIKTYGLTSGDVDLYRRVSYNELGMSEKDLLKSPESILGKKIKSRGFMSTSKYIEGTNNFDGQLIHFTHVSNSNKGLDISTFSAMYTSFEDEEEVLFNYGTVYQITKSISNGEEIYIEAEIL